VSLETLPENRERRCWGKVHRKTIPKIGGEDWEGPSADGPSQSLVLLTPIGSLANF